MRTLAWLLLGMLPGSASAAGLVNLSARGVTAAGAEVLTAGFVIAGETSKRVLMRAAGPALTGLGVTGALAQVRLEVFRNATLLATNSGWDSGGDGVALAQAMRAVGAFEFATGSRDAALLLSLEPGNYTAQVVPVGVAGITGVALVEIYDAEPASAARLINRRDRQ